MTEDTKNRAVKCAMRKHRFRQLHCTRSHPLPCVFSSPRATAHLGQADPVSMFPGQQPPREDPHGCSGVGRTGFGSPDDPVKPSFTGSPCYLNWLSYRYHSSFGRNDNAFLSLYYIPPPPIILQIFVIFGRKSGLLFSWPSGSQDLCFFSQSYV